MADVGAAPRADNQVAPGAEPGGNYVPGELFIGEQVKGEVKGQVLDHVLLRRRFYNRDGEYHHDEFVEALPYADALRRLGADAQQTWSEIARRGKAKRLAMTR